MTHARQSRRAFATSFTRSVLTIPLFFPALIVAGPLRASPPRTNIVAVEVADIDLQTRAGRLRRDFRVGEAAAAACSADLGQRATQYDECVRLAIEQARRTCASSLEVCSVGIDRFIRYIPPRRGFGPRSSG